MAVLMYMRTNSPQQPTMLTQLHHHRTQSSILDTFWPTDLGRRSRYACSCANWRRRQRFTVLCPGSPGDKKRFGISMKLTIQPAQALERGSWLDAWVEAPSPYPEGGTVLIPFFTETDLKYILDKILEVRCSQLCIL